MTYHVHILLGVATKQYIDAFGLKDVLTVAVVLPDQIQKLPVGKELRIPCSECCSL